MAMRPLVLNRRAALLAALAVGASGTRAAAQSRQSDDPWPSLSAQIFGSQPIAPGDDILALDAPYRAEEAAIVPLGLRSLLKSGDHRQISSITLVIDQNPSPLAAKFSLGPTSGTTAISTRVRIDDYTNVHAVAALSDGTLHGIKRFVKAAGGCSAPATKVEADAIPLGMMRFRQLPPEAGAELRQAQLLIRHPNYSGMQMDQLTRLYVPAHFVTSVRIWQGDALLLGIESGISISENPAFRFDYRPNGAASFRAEVQDSKGATFKQEWPVLRS